MPRTIIESVKGPFDHAYGLLMQFIDVCPENIWNEKFGGWPIWQQVIHTAVAIGFFVDQEGDKPLDLPCTPEESHLAILAMTPPDKEVIKKLVQQAKEKGDAYIARLNDTDLPQSNKGLAARLPQKPFTHGATIAMLGAHTMYHLGACDAALRAYGHKGVF